MIFVATTKNKNNYAQTESDSCHTANAADNSLTRTMNTAYLVNK